MQYVNTTQNHTKLGVAMHDFKGAYTALITPFDDGRIDDDALRALVDRQIESGIDGLVACGTTGETPTLTDSEKLHVIRLVAEQAKGRVPVIAGTGTNNTLASIQMTQEAAKIDGVEAALVITPYYNKPNGKGLIEHFEVIADQGGLPVIMYNVPGRTSIKMHIETVEHLSHHPGIVGLKEASGDLNYGSRIIEEVGSSMGVLSGDDFTTFGLCALGGRGCISVISNILPAEMSEMCHLLAEGELARAREIHYKIQPLTRLMFSTTNPIPVKTAAAMLDWCKEEFRLPLTTMQLNEKELIQDELERLELMG